MWRSFKVAFASRSCRGLDKLVVCSLDIPRYHVTHETLCTVCMIASALIGSFSRNMTRKYQTWLRWRSVLPGVSQTKLKADKDKLRSAQIVQRKTSVLWKRFHYIWRDCYKENWSLLSCARCAQGKEAKSTATEPQKWNDCEILK